MSWSWKDKKLDKDVGLDVKKIGRNWTAYALLLLAMGAMTFFGVCDPMGGGGMNVAGPTGAAASVDGEDISSVEFRRAYQNVYSQYQKQYAESFDPAMFQLSKMVLTQLVDQRILYEEAVNNGIYSTNNEVEQLMTEVDIFKDDKGKFSGELFETFLKNNRYTEESFTEEVRRNLTSEKFRRFLTDTYHVSGKFAEWQYRLAETKLSVDYLRFEPKLVKVTVTDDDVKKFLAGDGAKEAEEYYNSHKSDYLKEQQVKASHILVSYEGARNASGEATKRKKDDAKKMAQEIAQEAKKPGADFGALAQKHTDDASGKTKGGDLGFFGKDAMVKEFSDVAFKLKPGEVSDVVESPFGYHVIKVFEVKQPENTTFELAKNDIARKILEKDKQPEALEQMAKQALAAFKESEAKGTEFAAQNNVKWETTEKFALNAPTVPGIGGDDKVREAVLSLNAEKKLYPELLKVGNNYFVIRLKGRDEADFAKLTPKEKEDLAKRTKFMESYGLYNVLTTAAKKRFQDQGKVWMNDEYLNLDAQSRRDQGT